MWYIFSLVAVTVLIYFIENSIWLMSISWETILDRDLMEFRFTFSHRIHVSLHMEVFFFNTAAVIWFCI